MFNPMPTPPKDGMEERILEAAPFLKIELLPIGIDRLIAFIKEDRAVAVKVAVNKRDKKYQKIFDWLYGLDGDFPDLSQKPHYRFRTELRERLARLSLPKEK